ncbi:MAG: multidrug transporter [Rhodobacterales bacterium]|nr:MAG: multidrug transporter [Rhodobacterales bacterium]
MSDWLLSIAGTPEGVRVAALLALMSAFFHALFGALQKGKLDPWMARGAMDAGLALLSLPLALWAVPWPSGRLVVILLGAVAIHFVYKLAMAFAYQRAAYTVVYPVVRGTGPLVTVLAAIALFSEHYTALQWIGIACLSGGILLLALRNLSEEQIDRQALIAGLSWAFAGGLTVAIYTTYDAWGIRQAADPLTFLVWFFLLSSLDFPVLAWVRWHRMPSPPPLRELIPRGLLGAVVAYVSFGGVMLATRVGHVGQSAVLRETSTVFAALIGWVLLREKTGPRRVALMGLIALGAVIVQTGG